MNEITLHQPHSRPWGVANLSPFCIKLETYLRFTEIPYKLAKMSRGDAPKGKIPYVDLDGTLMGDSQLIIEELERRLAAEGKQPLDAGLSAHDAALGRVARRTLEEATYFIGVYMRWERDEGYAEMAREFKKVIPGFVLPIVRREQRKKIKMQGTARHTVDEVIALGAADFAAISELLGDKPFFLDDKPRVVDCTLHAFLEAMLAFPIDSKLKERIASHANLVAYRARVRERWFKDFL